MKNWAHDNHYDYHFMGDELFDYLSPALREKTMSQVVIATDLARLKALQSHLALGYETVIWCDADFLIFAPERWVLPNEPYVLGREVWIQTHPGQRSQALKAYIKVHNAFMIFRRDNVFLDFYTETAERLLTLNQGSMPPQFIGPKLLTAIHNIAQCPVFECAGMLSPLVIKDLISAGGSGPALDLFKTHTKQTLIGANLCSSMIVNNELNNGEMAAVIKHLNKDHSQI